MSMRKSNEKKISRRAVAAASKRNSRRKKKAGRRAILNAGVAVDFNDPMRFLRPKQTAALLGIHVMTVHKWSAKGIRLPPFTHLAPGVVGHWAQQLKKHLDEQQSNSAA